MRMIIADDNMDFTDNIARYIARYFTGIVCYKAYDGMEALELIKEVCSDTLGADTVAILDVKMPFVDGITLGKQLRGLYPKLKIVYVSAYDEVQYLHMAIRVGAVEYLTKPVDTRELSHVINRLLQGDELEPQLDEDKINLVDREERRIELCENFRIYVERNYFRPELSLDSIASVLYCSRSSLTMLVRECMHTTVTEYLNSVRLRKAEQLLLNERLRIEEIAQQVGFSGGNYFIRLFKARYGMTPAAWRIHNAGRRRLDEK